jgi:hypothetical protein
VGRLAWFLAGVGVAAAAAARFFLRRPPEATPPPEPPAPPAATAPVEEEDTRADDLRQRIEESRLLLDERDEFEAAETPIDEAADPDSRRRDVHDRARQMVERMRGDEPSA